MAGRQPHGRNLTTAFLEERAKVVRLNPAQSDRADRDISASRREPLGAA